MSNKIKRIIGFGLLIILLIIIKLFLSGTYLDHFLEELLPEILVLIIVSFILMIVPLIFKLVNKKRLQYKKGKNICLLNSIVIFILFSTPNLVNIIKDPKNNNAVMCIDPISFSKQLILLYFIIAIIYYFINICFFVDNKNDNN